jgi:hypothetical protein
MAEAQRMQDMFSFISSLSTTVTSRLLEARLAYIWPLF